MALYYSKGTISAMSEIKTRTSKSGNQWQAMTLTLEVPGYQGSIFKQVFSVFGNAVGDVMEHRIGDKVEVGWSMYAREWNGKWHNQVDLVMIKAQGEQAAQAAPQPIQADDLIPEAHPDDLPF